MVTSAIPFLVMIMVVIDWKMVIATSVIMSSSVIAIAILILISKIASITMIISMVKIIFVAVVVPPWIKALHGYTNFKLTKLSEDRIQINVTKCQIVWNEFKESKLEIQNALAPFLD